jgi:hypothetical protein
MIDVFKFLKKNKIYEFYNLIILFIILIQLFFIPSIRLGVITSIVILYVLFNTINKHDILRNTFINKLVLAYLFYNTISLFWFVFSGIPVSVFFAEWSNSILPIFFFYVANKKNKFDFGFYNITLFAIIISFILGFYLWMTLPPLYRLFMDTTEGPGTDMFFFQSLYGLTATGAMSVIGFLISARLVLSSKGRKGKIVMLICIIAAILTFRRSSMLVLFMSLIGIHYIGYIKYNFLKKRHFLLETLFIFLIIYYFTKDYGEFFENIIERSSMISEAFSERSGTWNYAFQDLTFIFGKGLGSTGHKAIGYTKTLIADGNYFKMIAEIGIFGVLVFFAIIITTLTNGLKDLKSKYLELGIVLSMCLIGIGSNIFVYQSIVPIFWYSVGRISYRSGNQDKVLSINA